MCTDGTVMGEADKGRLDCRGVRGNSPVEGKGKQSAEKGSLFFARWRRVAYKENCSSFVGLPFFFISSFFRIFFSFHFFSPFSPFSFFFLFHFHFFLAFPRFFLFFFCRVFASDVINSGALLVSFAPVLRRSTRARQGDSKMKRASAGEMG